MYGPPARRSAMTREARIALAGLIVWFIVTVGWWALAFWPVGDGPVWLERTRYVCFGVRGDGLPDAGGWVGLIGSPLGMLGMLFAGWRGGLLQLYRRVLTSPLLTAAAALAAAIASVAALGAVRSAHARAADLPLEPVAALTAADHPRIDRAAPVLSLIAQDGETRSLATLLGRPVLVTFAFGHCATVCPLVVRQALDVQASYAGSAEAPAVLIVSLDPWRDVPSRLPFIATSWQLPERDVWVLSGPVDEVEATLDAWRMPRTRDPRTGDISHPPLVYVVDAHGRIAFATTGGISILKELLARL